jgi:serine/threonine protein phosphatase PrpC
MSVHRVGPVPLHGLIFEAAGVSAQGPRKENQDAFVVDSFEQALFVAVADGMGGQRGGRRAADTALEALRASGEIRSLDEARFAMRAADEAVAEAARHNPDEREGMGCALAVLALAVDRHRNVGWVGAHVGDVRILSRSPDGTVRLETRDHTPAFARWEAGEIALDEVPDSPGANRLQRAVGRGGEADATWIPARPGWTYLLVSDGITKAMRLDELGEAMALSAPAEVCEAVARKVEERGPDDNYTAVMVRVLDGAGDGAGGGTLPAPPAAPRRAAAPAGAAPVFNPPSHVTRTKSSPWGAVAAVLALLALAAAGYAVWSAREVEQRSAREAAVVDSLRQEVTALRAQLTVPPDTIAPLPDTGAAPGAAAPDAAAAVPAAPQTTPRQP